MQSSNFFSGTQPGFSFNSTTASGNATNTNTGTSNPFGQNVFNNNQQPSVGLLGGTQQQTNAQSTSLFGQSNTASNTSTNIFGSKPPTTATTGLFGQQPQTNTSSTSLFGQQPQTNTSSTGLLGQQTQSASTGLFGQQPQSTTASSGLFGQQPQPTATGLFGQQTQPTSSSTSLFGQPGTTTASTGIFGQQTQPANATSGLFAQQPQSNTNSLSLFGQQPQATTNAMNTGLFNQNSSSNGLFGQKPSTGLFGQTGSVFGTLPSSSSSVFGQQNNTGTGIFGQQNNPMSQSVQPQPQIPQILVKFNNFMTQYDSYFVHPFYNVVPPNDLAKYAKPANISQTQYENAINSRPIENCVPVFATSFSDLEKRFNLQTGHLQKLETKLKEIEVFQSNVRLRNDEIESKYLKLNKKYEELFTRFVMLCCNALRMIEGNLNTEGFIKLSNLVHEYKVAVSRLQIPESVPEDPRETSVTVFELVKDFGKDVTELEGKIKEELRIVDFICGDLQQIK